MCTIGRVRLAEKALPSCHSDTRFIDGGICLLPAAEQRIPRATIPRFGMTDLWGFRLHHGLRINTLQISGLGKIELPAAFEADPVSPPLDGEDAAHLLMAAAKNESKHFQ